MSSEKFAKRFRVILIGPPGSGKGTQASLLRESGAKVSHISTGDILRNEIRKGSDIGLKAKAVIERGGLVSDEIILHLFKERIKEPDCDDGFILDGFPRTVEQAEGLQVLLAQKGMKMDSVVLIDVPERILMDRICGRRVHAVSGRTYHIKYNPPHKNGIDDITGEPLTQRQDDNEETLKKRLATYKMQTRPVVDYYSKRKLLRRVNGTLEVNKLNSEIKRAIKDAMVVEVTGNSSENLGSP